MRNSNAKPARLSKVATLEEYYDWLCSIISADDRINNRIGENYSNLIQTLYEKEFRYFVPNDDNRSIEGRDLSAKFCEEFDIEYVYDYFEDKCSMLELIIALAYRCESELVDRQDSIYMHEFFWKMLHNVGLDKYTDETWDEQSAYQVDQILNMIIERTYQRNGLGGLFPLKFARRDQRKVELWYQMSSYLVENYFTEEIFNS